MTLRSYVRYWLLITALLGYEAYVLNTHPFYSLFALLKENWITLKTLNLNPAPGKPISLWYGWAGFGIMALTNLYIFRKRISFLRNWGNLSAWLDFHILCGLVGPTLIVYHTNFKVGGLVAISFWSMMIAFASGVVGRYFYVQMGMRRSVLEQSVEILDSTLQQYQKKLGKALPEPALAELKSKAIKMAGVQTLGSDVHLSSLGALLNSLIGDIRLRFSLRSLTGNLPTGFRDYLKDYAIGKRRIGYLEQFQSIMGYWHSFHMPFAIFMYIIAVIHIAAALLFKVNQVT